ncbi:alpha/beta hydrolase [Rhodobacteraceae bacterium N5(2021)]|uniref:Alpha/beta hydrolase n=1 Tax=Gymnodinialimonas phycosphaerae TaxID=2841589 RepID=A0A975YGE1_9RHOB|nr:alpha/beta hydrolase [Gymnodinialimonas phycosphaerae]MBY4891478.1 alpha/beta hydrolase [Gymnodinialimonas phycosphaerae]
MDYVTAADGIRLAYDDQGQGVALLCLPGLTRNMDDFEPVLAHYRDRARVIRMDFRGRGASDHANFATYTPMQEAQDVVALLDHLGLDKVCVLGTSRGGLVALMLAVMARHRLSGVIFNDIGPEVMPEGLSAIMDYIGRAPAYSSLVEAAAALPVFYEGVFRNVPTATWADFARRVWREEGGRLHLRYDPKLRDAVAPAFAPEYEAPDLWPLFDALDGAPLGLIRGAQSNILSAETAAEMRRRRPDMAFVELGDRGHVPFLDEPGARAVIDDVLERCA